MAELRGDLAVDLDLDHPSSLCWSLATSAPTRPRRSARHGPRARPNL